MIVFRINANSDIGIGHLSRCRRLAKNLLNKYNIVFIVDSADSFISEYLKDFIVCEIYTIGRFFTNEKNDAKLCVEYLKGKSISCIVVDDYRLSIKWERFISNLKRPIIVIDDQNKNKHHCDLLVDSTWEGDKTYDRYKSLVNKKTFCLLGVKYLLIDEKHGLNNKNDSFVKDNNKVRLLLSLGGGGDLSILMSLAEFLVNNKPQDVQYLIRIVVGPYSYNISKLRLFSSDNDGVDLVENQDGLFDYLYSTDLYIGTSGGTLFESLSLRIPAVTFSISNNQKNDIENFESLGHYFHLDSIDCTDFGLLSDLVKEMVSQYERVKRLYSRSPNVKIDGRGVIRVSKAIDNIVKGGYDNEIRTPVLSCLKYKDNMELDQHLYMVDDFYVNRYLAARNMNSNLVQMTDNEKISRLDHYVWWFKHNKRVSYVFRKYGEDMLFIWHQSKNVKNIKIIVSGWFVASDNCSAIDSLKAITEHSKIIASTFSGFHWVIVTHKDNVFMQKYHERAGFDNIERNSLIESVVESCFPRANNTDFIYYQYYVK